VSCYVNDKESRIDFFKNIPAKLKQGGMLINAHLSDDITSFDYKQLLTIWAQMMADGEVQAQTVENIRQTHKNGISFLPPQEVAGIIQSAGFNKPVQFYQMAFIQDWVSRIN
jgi:tRNA (cmo5U34)-methyltransferase